MRTNLPRFIFKYLFSLQAALISFVVTPIFVQAQVGYSKKVERATLSETYIEIRERLAQDRIPQEKVDQIVRSAKTINSQKVKQEILEVINYMPKLVGEARSQICSSFKSKREVDDCLQAVALSEQEIVTGLSKFRRHITSPGFVKEKGLYYTEFLGYYQASINSFLARVYGNYFECGVLDEQCFVVDQLTLRNAKQYLYKFLKEEERLVSLSLQLLVTETEPLPWHLTSVVDFLKHRRQSFDSEWEGKGKATVLNKIREFTEIVHAHQSTGIQIEKENVLSFEQLEENSKLISYPYRDEKLCLSKWDIGSALDVVTWRCRPKSDYSCDIVKLPNQIENGMRMLRYLDYTLKNEYYQDEETSYEMQIAFHRLADCSKALLLHSALAPERRKAFEWVINTVKESLSYESTPAKCLHDNEKMDNIFLGKMSRAVTPFVYKKNFSDKIRCELDWDPPRTGALYFEPKTVSYSATSVSQFKQSFDSSLELTKRILEQAQNPRLSRWLERFVMRLTKTTQNIPKNNEDWNKFLEDAYNSASCLAVANAKLDYLFDVNQDQTSFREQARVSEIRLNLKVKMEQLNSLFPYSVKKEDCQLE